MKQSNCQNWLPRGLSLKNFMKKHNSVSLETVNVIKEAPRFAAKRKQASWRHWKGIVLPCCIRLWLSADILPCLGSMAA